MNPLMSPFSALILAGVLLAGCAEPALPASTTPTVSQSTSQSASASSEFAESNGSSSAPTATASVSVDETNGKVSRWLKNTLDPNGALTIAKQGMFSSGGTVTAPVAGTYDPTSNWLESRSLA